MVSVLSLQGAGCSFPLDGAARIHTTNLTWMPSR
jgi:hypothetical protein